MCEGRIKSLKEIEAEVESWIDDDNVRDKMLMAVVIEDVKNVLKEAESNGLTMPNKLGHGNDGCCSVAWSGKGRSLIVHFNGCLNTHYLNSSRTKDNEDVALADVIESIKEVVGE